MPATATAVAANLTVVQPTSLGHLTPYPGDLQRPLSSSINFGPGQTRANNAILRLATDGTGTILVHPLLADGGQVHLLVDINGYFASEPPVALTSTSPLPEEADVAVTRETILRFSGPLDPASVIPAAVFAESSGSAVPGHLYLSKDGRTVTLFYDEPLPAASRVEVTVDGEILRGLDGQKVEVDGNLLPGGRLELEFETLNLSVMPGTVVCGRVLASELAEDDAGSSVDVPLEGATVTVDGAESSLRATTDANGNFCLDPAPGDRFFVHIDGRTATNGVPPGAYYPSVGKAWDPVPGQKTNVGTAYLPLVVPGTLQPVSQTSDTVAHFAPSVLAAFPEFSGVRITVPAGSLFHDDGTPGSMVGIAPVPPNRLPGRLPPGLEFPVVITVQTDGATNFDSPAPVCFPNLPDPVSGEVLAAGAKSALWSFNHDAGRWEVVGPMTVTPDGTLACSDPGVGILAPGWHGARPGTSPTPVPKPTPPCDNSPASGGCIYSAAAGAIECGLSLLPGAGCALTVMRASLAPVRDCGIGVIISWKDDPSKAVPSCVVGFAAAVGAVAGDCLKKSIPGLGSAITCGTALGSYLAQCTCLLEGSLAADATGDFALHLNVLLAHRDFALSFLGSPAWLGIDPSFGDPQARTLQIQEILADFVEAMAEESDGGGIITPGESLVLRALPRPPELAEADVTALVDYLNRTTEFWRQGILNHADAGRTDFIGIENLLSRLDALEETFSALEQAGRTSLDFRGAILEATDTLMGNVTDPGAPPFDMSRTFFLLQDVTNGTVVRGWLGKDGRLPVAALRTGAFHRLSFFHPFRKSYGSNAFTSADPGQETDLPLTLFYPLTGTDSDGDGLGDAAEQVIGSRPDAADSDGDGTDDGTEIDQGTDPLDRLIQIGDVVEGAISVAGEIDRYSFTALAGQRVFFDLQAGSNTEIGWILVDETGSSLFNLSLYRGVGPVTLSQGGTYTVTIGRTGTSATGAYRFQIWEIPPPDTFAIAVGDTISNGVPGPGAGNIETPGASDVYTFDVSAGQVLFFDIQAGAGYDFAWRLTSPSGGSVFFSSFSFDQGPYPLAESGTYTLAIGTVDGDFSGVGRTGTYGLKVWETPAPQTFDVSIGDVISDGVPGPGAGNIEAPGTFDVYTFSAAAGQSVVFDVQSGGTTSLSWRLADPSGGEVFSWSLDSDNGPHVLAQPGIYTLTIAPRAGNDDYTGTYQFQIWDVSAPDSFAILVGDVVSDGVPGPGAGNIEIPGSRDVYTFEATAGQTIFFDVQSQETFDLSRKLVGPSGDEVFDLGFTDNFVPHTLVESGTYTLTLTGWSYSGFTGAYRFQIWDVPPPDTFAITIGDTISDGVPGPGAGNLESPCVQDVYAFSASPGQTIFFDLLAGASPELDWILTDPAGERVFFVWFQDVGPVTLDAGGTYTLAVNTTCEDTFGTYQFRILEVPPPDHFTIAVGDTVSNGAPGPGAGRIEVPGASDVYTFEALAGQTLFFDAQFEQYHPTGELSWQLAGPGDPIFYYNSFGDLGSFTFAESGVYTLTVTGYPSSDFTGAYRFQIWDVPPPDMFAVAIGDTVSDGVPGPGAGNIESPCAQDVYTFSASPGQTLFFDVLAGSALVMTWTLIDPAGDEVFLEGLRDTGPVTLSAGGTYRLAVNTICGDSVGAYGFQIVEAPAGSPP